MRHVTIFFNYRTIRQSRSVKAVTSVFIVPIRGLPTAIHRVILRIEARFDVEFEPGQFVVSTHCSFCRAVFRIGHAVDVLGSGPLWRLFLCR